MAISSTRIEYLLQRYAANNCTKRELLELFEWMQQQNDNTVLQNALQAVWQNRDATDTVPLIDKEQIYARIRQTTTGRRFSKRRKIWVRMAAAAVFMVACSVTWLLFQSKFHKEKQETAVVMALKNDVLPGHNGAVLTLSNGQQITLDSAGNGIVATDGSVQVIKKGGQVSYNQSLNRPNTSLVTYNTITTTKGRQWQLTLPDGTKVWLNAASSIKYPLVFTGSDREVGTQEIEDIGTEFNVNAYDDEPNVKTTLVSSSVKVNSTLLKPGQQAIATNNDIKVAEANTTAIVAWKDGNFIFRHQDLQTTMRQLARWYNVKVIYENPPQNAHIGGNISRSRPLSVVLAAMEQTGEIKFKLSGRTLTVTQ
jgi:ferric-dicitrate binding protein FerR (iron transport regulator)